MNQRGRIGTTEIQNNHNGKTMKDSSKEIGRDQKPPKLFVKVSNGVFVLGIVYSVFVAVYVVYKIYNSSLLVTPTFYYSCILFAILSAALFGIGLRWIRDEIKVILSVLFVAAGIFVYAVETYLEFSIKTIGEQKRAPYDIRTKNQVLEDLRKAGIETSLNVHPANLLKHPFTLNGLNKKAEKIFPIGGISNIKTLHQTEAGEWTIHETDEHGFLNSRGLYKNKIDIVLIGDSFVEGMGVKTDGNIAATLRMNNFKVISLGQGGNGPLLELATLKEYAEPLKPSIVLWLYYINDLDDLSRELKSTVLKMYMSEKDFSQSLITRQEDIDELLVDYVESENTKARIRERTMAKITKVIELSNLRSRIKLRPVIVSSPEFKKILNLANTMVSEWNGHMYFVYLPAL